MSPWVLLEPKRSDFAHEQLWELAVTIYLILHI